MIIEIRCTSCNAKLKVGDKFFGREIPCPKCEEPISVPSPKKIAATSDSLEPEKKSSVPYRGRKKKTVKRSSTNLPPTPPPIVEETEAPIFAPAASSPVSTHSGLQTRKQSNNTPIFLGIAAVAGLLLGGFFFYQAAMSQSAVAEQSSKKKQVEEDDEPLVLVMKTEEEIEKEQAAANRGLGFSGKTPEKSPLEGLRGSPFTVPQEEKLPADDSEEDDEKEPVKDPITRILPPPRLIPQKPQMTPPETKPPMVEEQKPPESEPIADASGAQENPASSEPLPSEPTTPTEPPASGRKGMELGEKRDAAKPEKENVERELVPLKPFKPYVHLEGEPVPNPAMAVPAMFSRKCLQAGYDPEELVAETQQRLVNARQRHLALEAKIGMKFLRAETHFATIHSQLPPAQTKRIAIALEKVGQILQEGSNSIELTVTRPDTFDLVILQDQRAYFAFLERMKPEWEAAFGDQWPLLKEVNGVSFTGMSIFYYQPPPSAPPEHMAVYQTAGAQMREITKSNSPDWLQIGFSAVCEYAVLGQNRVQAVDYQKVDLPLTPDWGQALIRLAQANQLRPWRDLFISSVQDWEVPDHVSAFGVVGFLMRSNPTNFREFLKLIAKEVDEFTALKDAYGKVVPALQNDWVGWIRRGG